MKKNVINTILTKNLLFTSIFIICFSHFTHASERSENPPQIYIGKYPQTVAAEIYVIAPGNSFQYDFSENDVKRVGCRYYIRNAQDIQSLVYLLVHIDLQEARVEKTNTDGRFLIRLHGNDGRENTILMEYDQDKLPTHGTYNGTTSILAPNGFEKDLRAWISQHDYLATKTCHGNS